jgi:hypothetical protein
MSHFLFSKWQEPLLMTTDKLWNAPLVEVLSTDVRNRRLKRAEKTNIHDV